MASSLHTKDLPCNENEDSQTVYLRKWPNILSKTLIDRLHGKFRGLYEILFLNATCVQLKTITCVGSKLTTQLTAGVELTKYIFRSIGMHVVKSLEKSTGFGVDRFQTNMKIDV